LSGAPSVVTRSNLFPLITHLPCPSSSPPPLPPPGSWIVGLEATGAVRIWCIIHPQKPSPLPVLHPSLYLVSTHTFTHHSSCLPSFPPSLPPYPQAPGSWDSRQQAPFESGASFTHRNPHPCPFSIPPSTSCPPTRLPITPLACLRSLLPSLPILRLLDRGTRGNRRCSDLVHHPSAKPSAG